MSTTLQSRKKLSILGSTGSIGTQTLDIVSAFPDKFIIEGLSAGKNITRFKEQLLKFNPKIAVIADKEDATEVSNFIKKHRLRSNLLIGEPGLLSLAAHPQDLLVVAIVGTTSLKPTVEAIKHGTHIGLACKEVFVAAGDIVTKHAKKHNVTILPIDSEHAALKQCLAGVNEDMSTVSKLILTASGGPFWNRDPKSFASITLDEALKHPNWSMGQKITIDSATLMNKGLEVIEAHHFFSLPYNQIDVIIHPKSIIHALVEFSDGTMLSQMGLPDMRFPIQYALTYPEKLANPWPKTNLASLGAIEFFEPNLKTFPLLQLAYDTGQLGGTYPAVLNAANEAVVAAFLNKKLAFVDIPKAVQTVVESTTHISHPTLDDIIALDTEIKEKIHHDFH